MTDFTNAPSRSLAGHDPAANVFAPAAKSLWQWLSAPFRAFFERELVIRELTGLDDRGLADIGISRSSIPTVVAGMYRRDGLAATKLSPDA